MDWILHAVYLPVREMNSAREFYREQVGLEEAWSEGDLAIAFQLPETPVQLIIGQITEESPVVAGPVFVIPSVDEFYSEEQDTFEFVGTPIDISPGRMATARDPSGNCLYFIDESKS
jgi:hypothetical protein